MLSRHSSSPNGNISVSGKPTMQLQATWDMGNASIPRTLKSRFGEENPDIYLQCELITGEFDPSLLPYDKRMAWHFKEFCYKTSAHGIPMIGRAPNRYYRFFILFEKDSQMCLDTAVPRLHGNALHQRQFCARKI